MMIPCDECLVKVPCTVNYRFLVRCPYLYYSMIDKSKISDNILNKMKRIEELFKLTDKGVPKNHPSVCFTLYPEKDPVYSVVMYVMVNRENRRIEILNPYEPNIRDLKQMGEHRWILEFMRKDIWGEKSG